MPAVYCLQVDTQPTVMMEGNEGKIDVLTSAERGELKGN